MSESDELGQSFERLSAGTRVEVPEPMLGRVRSCALFGVNAFPIEVEVAMQAGLPRYSVVGLATTSVKEGSARIRAALESIGRALPTCKLTVNLAPADRRKDGAAFDLPIALGILGADGALSLDAWQDVLILGELGLGASLRPVRGALAAALLAREMGLRGVVLPRQSAAQASCVEDIEVFAADNLVQVVDAMRGEAELPRVAPMKDTDFPLASGPDMRDVRGQSEARAALEIAAAGGHNVLLVGPPGIGKTMLARRVPTILPAMSLDEAIETTKVHSAAGLASDALVARRPFRAPHHSISPAGMIGGGTPPRAGEVSLAHNGVLFLDEMAEMRREAVEVLRQPLEDRLAVISRVWGRVELPASFMLVAAANPCPCGWLGSPARVCTDSPSRIARYRSRLSGPVLDRIDLHVAVPNVSLEDMRAGQPGEDSATIRQRVCEARARQAARLAEYGIRCNAEMGPRALRATCKLSSGAEAALKRLSEVRVGMSGRTIDRLIRLARTIADLDGQDIIDRGVILEAAGYRALDADPSLGHRQ